MRISCLFSALFLCAVLYIQPANAKYARPDLQKVPVERILTNLADQAAEKPKDAAIKFNLARAQAMAYATKATEVDVLKTTPDSPWYGYEPKNVPFQIKPTDDKTPQAAAEEHLAQALDTYEAALKLDNGNTVGRLGYAWCLEQAGQTEAAKAEYRQVIKEGWAKEGELKVGGLGFHSLVAEAGGYLKPHLDVTKDAAEIKELDTRITKILAIPRPITPIAVPLAAGLTANELEDRQASVLFDADGSGQAQRWSWIKPSAGWLVIDRPGTGRIDSGLQLFGNVTFWMFWEHGYEPLTALDNNHDGELRGAELESLAIWCDANQNGQSERGEVKSLSEHGIVALSCQHTIDREHADRIEFSAAGVTLRDGTTRPTFDLRLHPQR